MSKSQIKITIALSALALLSGCQTLKDSILDDPYLWYNLFDDMGDIADSLPTN
jgi:hypothetical protein